MGKIRVSLATAAEQEMLSDLEELINTQNTGQVKVWTSSYTVLHEVLSLTIFHLNVFVGLKVLLWDSYGLLSQ